MDLVFLSSTRPFRKTVNPNGVVTPAPLPYRLTSRIESVQSIQDLFAALVKGAHQGEVLMRGPLVRPLVNESRVQASNKMAPSEWLCLDIDGIENATLTDVLAALKIDCDYILHQSSSAGIKPGLRVHLFMLLDRPYVPTDIKRWLQYINLTTPPFVDALKLNRMGMSLRWPLDIVVADNSRLLFIAPPQFNQVPDPHPTHRFTLHVGKERAFKLNYVPNVLSIRALIDDKLTALQPPGMSNQKVKTKWSSNLDSDLTFAYPSTTATVTGEKDCGDYIRLNLNGGDRFSYYFYKDSPQLLFNFKGEPTYRLSDIIPQYLRDYIERTKGKTEAFLNAATEDYIIAVGYEMLSLRSWSTFKATCRQIGVEPPHSAEDTPVYQIVFRPDLPYGLNAAVPLKYFNTFYMPDLRPEPKPFPHITLLLKHLCVDMTTFDYFVNWLAFVYRHKERSGTAWILSGTTGTGKGLLFNHVLSPLVGVHNTQQVTQSSVESSFNNYVYNCLLLLYDEAEFDPNVSRSTIEGKLKNMITEPKVRVNRKYVAEAMEDNYCNLVMTSNQHNVTKLSANDRRFNVAPRQEVPLAQVLPPTMSISTFIDNLAFELPGFAHHLSVLRIDYDKVRVPLMSDSRTDMIDLNTRDYEFIGRKLNDGDLSYFMASVEPPRPGSPLMLRQVEYNTVIERIQASVTAQQEVALTITELRAIFTFHCRNISETATTFGRILRTSGIKTVRRRSPNSTDTDSRNYLFITQWRITP